MLSSLLSKMPVWILPIVIFCSGLFTVTQTFEVNGTEEFSISDFVEGLAADVDGGDYEEDYRPEESFSPLSLSKDWALQFDKDTGREGLMSAAKQLEIHNNLLKVAELLHIIPEGSASRYSDLILTESNAQGSNALQTTESSHRDNDLGITVTTLRRYGITTFMNQNDDNHYHPYPKFQQAKVKVQTKTESLPTRKFSPRLAMHSNSVSTQAVSAITTPDSRNVRKYV